MHFSLQPLTFATDRARVAFVLTQLTGRARLWGTAAWQAQLPCTASFQSLAGELLRVFDRTKHGRAAGRELLKMRQRGRSVADYAIEFQTLAATSGWGKELLCDAFLQGLADQIKDRLLLFELPESLEGIANLALRMGSSLEERALQMPRYVNPAQSELTATYRPVAPPLPAVRTQLVRASPDPSLPDDVTPMEVGRSRVTEVERERRFRTRSCFFCGRKGHFIAACPLKGPAH